MTDQRKATTRFYINYALLEGSAFMMAVAAFFF